MRGRGHGADGLAASATRQRRRGTGTRKGAAEAVHQASVGQRLDLVLQLGRRQQEDHPLKFVAPRRARDWR